MKVILLDNIRGIGRIGDVKEVSDGYARNFLIARGKAKPATVGAAREAESQKAHKLESLAFAEKEARVLAKKLSGVRIQMSGRANAQGTLFSGIPAAAIAERISEVAGAHITPSQLQLHEPLKTIGEHTVTVTLAHAITADLCVVITTQK